MSQTNQAHGSWNVSAASSGRLGSLPLLQTVTATLSSAQYCSCPVLQMGR